MYNFEKKSCLWIGILVFAMVLVYMRCTNAVEPFVLKAQMVEDEIKPSLLFDQHDMAAVMNGLKPKSITGDYTGADMKELIRLFKVQGMKQMFGETVDTFNTKSAGYDMCVKGVNSTKCKMYKKLFQLISEQKAIFENGEEHVNITNKDEYLRHLMKTFYDIHIFMKDKDELQSGDENDDIPGAVGGQSGPVGGQ